MLTYFDGIRRKVIPCGLFDIWSISGDFGLFKPIPNDSMTSAKSSSTTVPRVGQLLLQIVVPPELDFIAAYRR